MNIGATNDVTAPRRRFLTGLAALGAGALMPGCRTAGQVPAVAGGKPHRIDVHHHILPPKYLADIAAQRVGGKPPSWTPAMSLEEMDRSGIATSVTSLLQPGAAIGDFAMARRISREANEYAARMVADFPGRFGLFAAIPYADTEGSLKEIEYALETLKAEGVYLVTNYGGKYPGDPAFRPVLEELNRRMAVVYTHPYPASCCQGLLRGVVGDSTIEYAVDTTRAMASVIFTGAAARYPDIRWIFSHSGGVTPFLLSRFQRAEATLQDKERKLPTGVMHELRKFYYDTAQGNHPGALDALRKIAPVSQYLYGTDYPFRDGAEVNGGLAGYGFSAAELRAIDRDNALRLFPKLRA